MNIKILDALILILVLYLFYNFYYKENFENFQSDEGQTLTLYYAPWCGHCHKLLKEGWKELPDTYKGVKIQKVDCTKEENQKYVKEFNIGGFPTILLKKSSKEHLEYRGNRRADDIIKFIEKNIGGVQEHEPHHHHQQQMPQLQEKKAGFKPNFTAYYAPWCGHSKRLLEKGWKDMPPTYRGVEIRKVDSTQPGNDKIIDAVRDESGNRIVKGYPTMLLEVNPGVYHKYVGDRSTKHMLSFIDHQMEQHGMVRASQPQQPSSGSSGFRPNFSVYYAPWCGHSVNLMKKGWSKMPESYKGLQIRAVDMTKDHNKHYSNSILKPDGSKYIRGFPTILLEKTENNFVEYNGNRTYEDMIRFIDSNM